MKRVLDDSGPIKRIKTRSLSNDEIRQYLKTECHCGIVFNNIVDDFNNTYCIVNLCIDTDDDELLDTIVHRWSRFRERFSELKCMWMKRISDNFSHRCYGYFKIHLGCNFLPEKYYNMNYN